jgi:hypothetical protein
MNIGMLWFDSDPKADLADKVERAAHYYQNKYGKLPTVCFVHPSMLPADGAEIPAGSEDALPASPILVSKGVEVRPHPHVRPNHFWIGVNGVK